MRRPHSSTCKPRISDGVDPPDPLLVSDRLNGRDCRSPFSILKRPQPAMLVLIASGYAPVYRHGAADEGRSEPGVAAGM